MPDDDALVIQLAGAIVDATGPDWAAAESTAATTDARRLIRELRVVAALAAVHRDPPSSPASTATAAPNDTLSRWGPLLLRGTIGQGHFGTVYLAWDETLERQVALKLLRGTARAGEIIQEGRLLARVRHPNVVTVYGVDRHDGVVGLWMEFVDGLTLARVVATRGALDPREAALVGIDLCRAVAAVHKAGLVHRDIKAHNVMREGSGRIVLMDFGSGELRTERSGARVCRRYAAVPGSRVVRRRACDDCQRRLQHGGAVVPPRDDAISGRRRDAGADCRGAGAV